MDEGKFVMFQMIIKDEKGDNYPYPASAEDVATQLQKMGYRVYGPFEAKCMKAMFESFTRKKLGLPFPESEHEESLTKVPRMSEAKHHIKAGDDVTEHITGQPIGPFKAIAIPYIKDAMDGILSREHEALLDKLSDPRAKALGRAALTKAAKDGFDSPSPETKDSPPLQEKLKTAKDGG